MKKFIKVLSLCALSLGVFTVHADPMHDLQKSLSNFNALSCDFTQEVYKADGAKLSESQGRLLISKPDKLLMHTQSPDEQYLLTKDNAVYFYDPFVNQVTIFSVSDLNTAPFLLLNSNDKKLWNKYEVIKVDGGYTLKAKDKGDLKTITLKFSGNVLNTLSLSMRNGNVNTYKLNNQSTNVNVNDFFVDIPDDAEVDDERRSH